MGFLMSTGFVRHLLAETFIMLSRISMYYMRWSLLFLETGLP